LDEPFVTLTEERPASRTQKEMIDHLIPRVKAEGMVKMKTGKRLARHAKKGEVITTVVDGEVVNVRLARDETSMVVRQDTVDKELFLMTEEEFSVNYHVDSASPITNAEIREHGETLHRLRKDGFKYYSRKGAVVLLKITEEDSEFCPSGFCTSFSAEPRRCEEGNYFAMPYPRMSQVYTCYHADAIYAMGQDSVIPNQKQMADIFLETMIAHDLRKPRVGERMARPARRGEEVTTVVKGNEVAKRVADNDSYMIVIHQHEGEDTEAFLMPMHEFDVMYGVTEKPVEERRYVKKGYKMYKRKGETLLYKLTKEDIDSKIPMGFWTDWSDKPQIAQEGDYLATPFPTDDSKPDLYICQHARSIYKLDDEETSLGSEFSQADEVLDMVEPGEELPRRTSIPSLVLLAVAMSLLAVSCLPSLESHRCELFGAGLGILALTGWVSERSKEVVSILFALVSISSTLSTFSSSQCGQSTDVLSPSILSKM
jgi:hypothetical protein